MIWQWVALLDAYLLGIATVAATLAVLNSSGVEHSDPSPQPPPQPPADDGWAEAAELLGVPLHDYGPPRDRR